MLPVESCRWCAVCGTVTPHSCQRLRAGLVAGVLLLALAGWSALRGGPWLAAAALAFLATYVLLRERDRHLSVRCERCRTRADAALGRTKPALDERTEIDIF